MSRFFLSACFPKISKIHVASYTFVMRFQILFMTKKHLHFAEVFICSQYFPHALQSLSCYSIFNQTVSSPKPSTVVLLQTSIRRRRLSHDNRLKKWCVWSPSHNVICVIVTEMLTCPLM